MPIVPSTNVRSYRYVDDAGEEWTFRGQAQIYEQADGTGPITSTVPFTGTPPADPWPSGWKRRVAIVTDVTTGKSAEITCSSTTARLWVGTANVIELHRSDGTVGQFTRVGVRGEQKRPLNHPGP